MVQRKGRPGVASRPALMRQDGGTKVPPFWYYMPGQGGVPLFGMAPSPFRVNFCRRLPV